MTPKELFFWYKKGIQFGRDGSVLFDDCDVFVLPMAEGEMVFRQTIDYFHGTNAIGTPVCQTKELELDLYTYEMINANGITVRRVRSIQQRWRRLHP